jgi:2-amino-4-hydroxy-6-hydroxymethyldihydropteridine diphosphokinase
MPKVHVGIGSNIERERNVRAAIAAMRKRFGELDISRIYETEPVGFEGDPFYNMVATFDTDLPPMQLVDILREIENGNERDRQTPRLASRTLDLDLLLYGDLAVHQDGLTIPREDITRHAFVLRPLADIAGDTRHPVSGKTFAELWAAFDASEQPTRPVHIHLN